MTIFELCEQSKDSDVVVVIRRKGPQWITSHSDITNLVEAIGAVELMKSQLLSLLKKDTVPELPKGNVTELKR